MMLRISGPDPKGRKMRQHAFFQSRNGITTLSASGFSLLPSSFAGDLLAVSDASLIESFIQRPDVHNNEGPPTSQLPSPFGPVNRTTRGRKTASSLDLIGRDQTEELLPGTKIEALFEEESGVIGWQEAELVGLRDVPEATAALASLLTSHASIDSGGWELGWHLVSAEKAPAERPSASSTPTFPRARTSSSYLGVRGPSSTSGPARREGSFSLRAQDAPPFVTATEERSNGAAQPLVRIAILRVRLSSEGQATAKQQAQKAASSQFGNPSSRPGLRTVHAPSERVARADEGVPAALFSDARVEVGRLDRASLVSAGPLERGDLLTAVGSPFGALAAGHFANSISVGVVSNWWLAGKSRAPILLLDMRCLPGMEGGPVLDRSGGIVGMLWRPMRQRKSGAEVQLMITSDALAPVLHPFGVQLIHRGRSSSNVSSSSGLQGHRASSAALPSFPSFLPRSFDTASFEGAQVKQNFSAEQSVSEAHSPSQRSKLSHSASQSHPTDNFDAPSPPVEGDQAAVFRGIHTSTSIPEAARKAGSSVVMLAVDDGAWASGVVLSTTGLILTNAHLIEPWRFTARAKVHGSSLQTAAQTLEDCAQTDGMSASGSSPSGGDAELLERMSTAGLLEEGTDEGLIEAQTYSSESPRSDYSSSAWAQDSRGQHALWVRADLDSAKALRTDSQCTDSFATSCILCSGSDSQHANSGPLHDRNFHQKAEGRFPSKIRLTSQKARTEQNLLASSTLSPVPTASNPPRQYALVRVCLSNQGSATWQSARVLFVSQGPLDVAILQLLDVPTGLQPIIPAEHVPSPGATAIVVGHGLFGPLNELRPSVHCGVVSKLVKASGRPAMLQTTAAVHPGGSGGAVADESGRLIGLVTSAARHSGGSMLPHLNFSIPVEALRPVFAFVESGALNVGLLEALNEADSNLSATWALAPPPSLPRPSHLLPRHPLQNAPGQKDSHEGSKRGTKFAQFLNERGQELLKLKSLRSRL